MEVHRLRVLLESAHKQLQKVNGDKEKSQIESAKARSDFYDKLAIGAGATIAALVSFLGSHFSKLHPVWILRGSLISLVLVIAASLFRNYRYPNYVLQIYKISWIRCTRYEQECRLNCLKAEPHAIGLQSGQPIRNSNAVEELAKSNAELGALLKDEEAKGERMMRQWTMAQLLAISFATLSMVLLVWLAIANF